MKVHRLRSSFRPSCSNRRPPSLAQGFPILPLDINPEVPSMQRGEIHLEELDLIAAFGCTHFRAFFGIGPHTRHHAPLRELARCTGDTHDSRPNRCGRCSSRRGTGGWRRRERSGRRSRRGGSGGLWRVGECHGCRYGRGHKSPQRNHQGIDAAKGEETEMTGERRRAVHAEE